MSQAGVRKAPYASQDLRVSCVFLYIAGHMRIRKHAMTKLG